MTTPKEIRLLTLATFFTAMVCSVPARADLIVSVGTVTASAGSIANSLEVDLRNTGSAVTIGGFSFEVSVSNPDINFTQADTSTTQPYIFPTDSLFGPFINTTAGSSLTASDLSVAGVTIAADTTVGLGDVLFNVAPGAAAGTYSVTLAPWPATSLSDPAANDVPITTLNAGQIQITGAQSVPEPSPVIFVTAMALLVLVPLRPRLKAANPSH